MKTNTECMEDCIHLHACRRFANLIKMENLGRFVYIARRCNMDCTAYQNKDDFASENMLYTYDEVQRAINGATRDALNGYTDNIVSDYL